MRVQALAELAFVVEAQGGVQYGAAEPGHARECLVHGGVGEQCDHGGVAGVEAASELSRNGDTLKDEVGRFLRDVRAA